ncbi:HipA domain-containing protein [Myxococcota bacterium]|nr:HipA domain-containing protein [Myxococcota bacterium]
MAERKIIVFIYLQGESAAVPAGIFTHDADSGVGRFAYGLRYLQRPEAIAVDPVALPLGVAPREVTSNGGLYGAFRDAAPDYWGRLVIAAESKLPPEALSEIDFLTATNATRVGNLDFRTAPDDAEPTLSPPHFNQLSEVMQAASSIQAGEQAESHLLQLLRQGSSMGGARPKCTVEWDRGLWLAKFSAKDDTLNNPRIEYATMSLARLCGLSIPEVRLVQVGDKDVFLIRRFDREPQGKSWLRHGFMSSLSLMQWDERDRLRWSYPAIADRLRRYMGPADIRELFRRMVFNILVRNTDDHPRNHGVLSKGDKLSLSPAYDIVPTLTHVGVGTDFRLAMSLGKDGREATLQNAVSHAARFGISKEESQTMIDELLSSLRQWRGHFEESGLPGREIDALAASFWD